MISPVSLINGQFKEKISVFDRGLSYGDGLFETMIWHNEGTKKKEFLVEYWRRHINRLKKGCKILKIKIPRDKILNEFRYRVLKKSYNQGIKSGILKILITRGSGGRGYKFDSALKPTIIFQVFPYKKLEKKKIS